MDSCHLGCHEWCRETTVSVDVTQHFSDEWSRHVRPGAGELQVFGHSADG